MRETSRKWRAMDRKRGKGEDTRDYVDVMC